MPVDSPHSEDIVLNISLRQAEAEPEGGAAGARRTEERGPAVAEQAAGAEPAGARSGGLESEESLSEEEDEEEDEDEEPEGVFPEQSELAGYKLLGKIGEGAFSEVYRAVPLKDGPNAYLSSRYKQVAVKVISKKRLSTTASTTGRRRDKREEAGENKATSREQVLKEITIHKAVSSGENIVTFIDFQETESYYFIVQELLAGGEIFGEIVRLTYFSEDLSRHVIRQLALAVKHMHSLGIVHRDIKPENLLFSPIDFIPSKRQQLRQSDDPKTKQDEGLFRPGIGGGGIGVIKLADFGLSKQIYATNTTTPCGTVGYTAPEVVKDERYSMKVDMWGIGCVLYTVLCGFPPFYDEKIDVLTELISKGQYTFLRPWWDEISPGAKNAVRRLLEVDPDKRYDIDEFLADPWLNSYDCNVLRPLVPLDRRKRHAHNHSHKPYKKDSTLIYSPAAVAMRDALDISNAVQREEEAKHMTPGGHQLGALREDEEESAAAFGDLDHNMFQLRLNSSTILKRRNQKKPAQEGIGVNIPMTVEEI
ncbi:AAL029Wp [Eremothecium gossypii ATCC 10895]|uniref:non-specific serine/threonine protein kinase n=1 Tax=Eremothecium gossypii (strain ATCC 10895 / CBS 109.51 / FGSC 9923 / NRRL Y-1056) TaxID=284811 RepID=Q75EV7_EREGS|nr:AAL029Wp [Eremothecium gossypii ATCC 10895]AAS50337.1 AAL029Wp [Eremothecium gossypii ATCC 10895]AEY94623.1 FAAL029Wp [Eremothecium gossypii FDAG1]